MKSEFAITPQNPRYVFCPKFSEVHISEILFGAQGAIGFTRKSKGFVGIEIGHMSETVRYEEAKEILEKLLDQGQEISGYVYNEIREREYERSLRGSLSPVGTERRHIRTETLARDPLALPRYFETFWNRSPQKYLDEDDGVYSLIPQRNGNIKRIAPDGEITVLGRSVALEFLEHIQSHPYVELDRIEALERRMEHQLPKLADRVHEAQSSIQSIENERMYEGYPG